MEEGDEDSWNINITELEGLCEIAGPDTKIHDISQPVKKKQVNIGSEAAPKFTHIIDYWYEDTVGKVTELLDEYHDLFLTKFSELKVIVGDLGMVKINLKWDTKPVKKFPYQLNPKYKEKVREETIYRSSPPNTGLLARYFNAKWSVYILKCASSK